MSTRTTNYGLYMPDPTDPFEDFRTEHNSNMQIIDSNLGGGGSGGHTIVNPSGTDMPAEGKLQFTGGVTVTDDSVNGKTVVDISGGGGNVYGAFIDPTRSLTSSIAFSKGTPINYTATEDCIVEIYNDSANTLEYCVDGLAVYFLATGSYTLPLPLKKGQTLTSVSANNYSGAYHAYGLTQGTSGIFTPIIYSDNERVIGVWRDGKPLYQRILTLTQDTTLVADTWVKTEFNKDTMETLVRVDITIGTTGAVIEALSGGFIDGKLALNSARNVGFNVSENARIIVQYTKTTDVAGSGNWNTDGVPTVHYSTSEQVIGTWENGKPLYQQTVIFDTGNVASNIDFNISAYMPVNSVVRDSSFTLDFSFNGDTYHGANWGGAYVEINGVPYLSFNIGSAVYNKHVELTIKYTKTTD